MFLKSIIGRVKYRLNVLRQAYRQARFTIEYGFYDDDRR